MKTQHVTFYSEGAKVAALLRTPDAVVAPLPAIIQGAGWLGFKDAAIYLRYHEAFTQAGYAVLVIDYRGTGDSEGPRDLSIREQLKDLANAVAYLASREEIDEDRMGVFGTGGTGGGNAIILAAEEPLIRCTVCQLPVADGADWLRRMRSEEEWISFLDELNEDRRTRALTGSGRIVDPRREIMIPAREPRSEGLKGAESRVPQEAPLTAAIELLRYRPIEAAANLTSPVLIVAVEDDPMTPVDHAQSLYEAAKGPKELIIQRDTTHYSAYDKYGDVVISRMTQWFDRYLAPADVVVYSTGHQSGAD